MKAKPIPLSVIRRAVILRSAGLTLSTISTQLGIPRRTLDRVMARSGVRRGDLRRHAIEQAKREIAERAESVNLAGDVAALVLDDVETSRRIRDSINKALDLLDEAMSIDAEALGIDGAAQIARSLTALSTAAKNMGDVRERLPTPELPAPKLEPLPIVEMSADEVRRIQDELNENMPV